jgi:hypothetical protein
MSKKEEVAACVGELSDLLQKGSLTERKSFVRCFIKEVKVLDKEVKLTYTFPEFPGGTEKEERTAVPSIVHNGGRYWTRTSDLCNAIPAIQLTSSVWRVFEMRNETLRT